MNTDTAKGQDPIILSSVRSTRTSLEAVRSGKAGLDAHRQSLLERVPKAGDYAKVELGSLEMKDIAYLTAKTGVEFAILRGKNEDILFRGDSKNCLLDEELRDALDNHRLQIIGHSHPGEPVPVPSENDRVALRRIGQSRSKIISGMTGICTDFGQDPFEMPTKMNSTDENGSIFEIGGDENANL